MWQPIQTQSDLLARQFGNEETGIAAVSFTAAALWLFLDLDMPGIEKASSYRLAEQVASLASIIRKLTQRLRRSTEDLSKLIANRSSGNRPELPGNNHVVSPTVPLGTFQPEADSRVARYHAIQQQDGERNPRLEVPR